MMHYKWNHFKLLALTQVSSYFYTAKYIPGHPVHEWTSYAAQESIFKYIKEKYEKRLDDILDERDSECCIYI